MTSAQKLMQDTIMTTSENNHWSDYELLDSGDGKKLERFGAFRFVRPESQALWQPKLSRAEWEKADGVFQETQNNEQSQWKLSPNLPERWKITYNNIDMWIEPTSFRHFGVFPEQAAHWDWMVEKIIHATNQPRILNLFGYTGIASLFAAQAGALVTHVDASKKSVAWARENQLLSKLEDKPIRWIVDDALTFIQREIRRGVSYQGIIIDPPKFGRGPKGELWKLETMLPQLLRECAKLLTDPLFIILTVYAVRLSSTSLNYTLRDSFPNLQGSVTSGELTITESSGHRSLSPAIYARWDNK
ncbi:MAG: class I SAM-dependent methyltransferase [Candidatus Roizmanbacteria bacterium]|nr:class I SAM-dependent methyltransferase [Candidatus Roizmanbacteria bacterium]